LIWRLLDFAGSQVAGPIKFFKFQRDRAIDGRMDMEQQWKRCIEVVQNELPLASGLLITRNLPANFKRNANEIYEGVKGTFSKLIANAAWLDEAVRTRLQSKLQSLVPLISHPTSGFNQSEIVEFYGEAEINSQHYIATLFQLRIIDADDKFKQTYAAATVNDVDNCRKYLPPSSLAAFYSKSDNTLRKCIEIIYFRSLARRTNANAITSMTVTVIVVCTLHLFHEQEQRRNE
jgi:predicted metalloendopeptidase